MLRSLFLVGLSVFFVACDGDGGGAAPPWDAGAAYEDVSDTMRYGPEPLFDVVEGPALIVLGNVLISARTQCQIRKGATLFRPAGVLDVAVTNEYFLFPMVENLLAEGGVDEETPDHLRLDSNGVTFLGVEVAYDYDTAVPGALSFIDEYQYSFFHASGFVPPADASPMIAKIVGTELGDALRATDAMRDISGTRAYQLVARIVVHGVLPDHTTVRSEEFYFPLTVCAGCLVYTPSGVDPTSLTGDIEIPCFVGQDDGVDVRLCYHYAPPYYVEADTEYAEAVFIGHDRCLAHEIFGGRMPPESDYYWDRYREQFEELYPYDPRAK